MLTDRSAAALFPKPISCDRREGRHVIASLAENYRQSELGPFLVSARRVMPPETVDIILFSNTHGLGTSFGASVHRCLTRFAAEFLPYRTAAEVFPALRLIKKSILVYRWFLFAAFAELRCHVGYMFVDVRDTYFQANIFSLAPRYWWQDVAIISTEAVLMKDRPRQPNVRMLECLFGQKQNDGASADDTEGRLRREHPWENTTTACGGVFGGGGASLRRFLASYTNLALQVGDRSNCDRWIPDQIILSYLTRFPYRRDRIAQAGVRFAFDHTSTGLVWHMNIEHLRKHLFEFFPTKWATKTKQGWPATTHCWLPNSTENCPMNAWLGDVLNENGMTPALVHQFDRSPELTAMITNLVRHWGLPNPHMASNGKGGWG